MAKKNNLGRQSFFSKILAMVLFILLPIISFLVGMSYQKGITVSDHPNISSEYKGKLPCADCSGIDATLTFFIDRIYLEKNDYIGRNTSFNEWGIWNIVKGKDITQKGTIYELISSDGEKKTYYLEHGKKLTPLDSNLKEISSPFDISLTRVY